MIIELDIDANPDAFDNLADLEQHVRAALHDPETVFVNRVEITDIGV